MSSSCLTRDLSGEHIHLFLCWGHSELCCCENGVKLVVEVLWIQCKMHVLLSRWKILALMLAQESWGESRNTVYDCH